MSNLLPPPAQKAVKAQYRARFLLALALGMLFSACLVALSLAPAEVALLSFSPPGMQKNSQASANLATDNAALAQTKALLADLAPLNSTSSLDALVAALSEAGPGMSIDDIQYNVTAQSIALSGRAQSPDDVNTFREALQSDLRFSNVSVPVSELLGGQNGTFTISMNIAQ